MKSLRTCGIEIAGNELYVCLLTKEGELFNVAEIRKTRFDLPQAGQDLETMRKFQRDIAKLFEDYKVDSVAIKQRQLKGKFAGSAAGFKMETAIQLIEGIDVRLLAPVEIKEQLKRNPIPVAFAETGLKKFQEGAFINAYVYQMIKTYQE